jgi:hypothetical protein
MGWQISLAIPLCTENFCRHLGFFPVDDTVKVCATSWNMDQTAHPMKCRDPQNIEYYLIFYTTRVETVITKTWHVRNTVVKLLNDYIGIILHSNPRYSQELSVCISYIYCCSDILLPGQRTADSEIYFLQCKI